MLIMGGNLLTCENKTHGGRTAGLEPGDPAMSLSGGMTLGESTNFPVKWRDAHLRVTMKIKENNVKYSDETL